MRSPALFVAFVVAAGCVAGCDDRVRVDLLLHTTALTPAEVASVTLLSIEAQYDGATNGTTDVTKSVPLGAQALEDPERIELVFPDATRSITIDVAAQGSDGVISEIRSGANLPVSPGLTSVDLSLPGSMQMMNPPDLRTVDLSMPMFTTLPAINTGVAVSAVIAGNWELTGDELVVATAGGVEYKLPHIATSPYLGAPALLSMQASVPSPIMAADDRQIVVANTSGFICLVSFVDGSTTCDNTGVELNGVAVANVPANDLAERGLVAFTSIAGLYDCDPVTAMAAPIDVPGTSGSAVVFAKLDTDSIDVAYAAGTNLRICHALGTCIAGPALPVGITRLSAVDLDRDGQLDLFAFDGTLGHYLRNLGTSPATFMEMGTLAAIGSPVFGDFNGDTAPDLAYLTTDKTGVIVTTLAGTTTSVSTTLIDKVGSGLFALFAVELDGKVPIDLVAVDTTGKITPIIHP